MDAQRLLIGFAILVLGLALGRLDRWRHGWFVLSVAAVVIGLYGLGYGLGADAMLDKASAAVERLPFQPTIERIGAMRIQMIQLRAGLGVLTWSLLFIAAGAIGCVLTYPFVGGFQRGKPPVRSEKEDVK